MSKTSLTILLFAITIFLGFYSMYRVSQPRILSESEMLVNGFVEYGEYEELRDFKLTDHNGNEFTNENLKQNKLNWYLLISVYNEKQIKLSKKIARCNAEIFIIKEI